MKKLFVLLAIFVVLFGAGMIDGYYSDSNSTAMEITALLVEPAQASMLPGDGGGLWAWHSNVPCGAWPWNYGHVDYYYYDPGLTYYAGVSSCHN